MTSIANQGQIVFFSPSFSTTQGHRSILRVLTAVLRNIFVLDRTPFQLLLDDGIGGGQDMQWLCGVVRPRVVIVDFPDRSAVDMLWDVRRRTKPRPLFVYLGMCATESGRSDFPYDLCVELEPDTRCTLDVPCIQIAPIINLDHIAEAPSRALPLRDTDSVLWLESGTDDERMQLGLHLREIFQRRLTRSSELPQPASRFLRHWPMLISASGYSSFWEIVALGLAENTRWLHYERALEDVQRRVNSLQDATITQLGERARTGMGPLELTAVIHQLLIDPSMQTFFNWYHDAGHMKLKEDSHEIQQTRQSDHRVDPSQPGERGS